MRTSFRAGVAVFRDARQAALSISLAVAACGGGPTAMDCQSIAVGASPSEVQQVLGESMRCSSDPTSSSMYCTYPNTSGCDSSVAGWCTIAYNRATQRVTWVIWYACSD